MLYKFKNYTIDFDENFRDFSEITENLKFVSPDRPSVLPMDYGVLVAVDVNGRSIRQANGGSHTPFELCTAGSHDLSWGKRQHTDITNLVVRYPRRRLRW